MYSETAVFSRVWAPLLRAMTQAGCSGQEWAVMVALLRFQDDSTRLSMSVRQIAFLTGLDEDTVRHRIASLTKRTFLTKGGLMWPIIELEEHASRGRMSAYRLNVPRYMEEGSESIVSRAVRIAWERNEAANSGSE